MTNPLHAPYYADHALYERAEVLANERLARDTYRIRLASPQIAARIVPGQFLMCRLPAAHEPLLARPLALYDVVLGAQGEATALDLVYLVVGRMTSRLAALRGGEKLEIWGPLGNGFSLESSGFPAAADPLVMVAGGIGLTPFVALAAEALGQRAYGLSSRQTGKASRVILCYGARSKDLLAGLEDFQRLGVEVRLATDDGTAGHHGFVTDLVAELLAAPTGRMRIVCCGPEPMMQRVSEMALAAQVPCQVSLETPMACGIGICFSCVAKIRQQDGGWDYKRTCVEGPIFDAAHVIW